MKRVYSITIGWKAMRRTRARESGQMDVPHGVGVYVPVQV